MSSTITFTPHNSSPLARTTSPFKDPRPPPCTPGKTAKIWDEYERRAVENAQRRDTTYTDSRRQTQQSSRFSSGTVLDIIKSYDPNSSPKVSCSSPAVSARPQFDHGLPLQQSPYLGIASSTTVATCKTCKRAITSALGICEGCKRTIVLSSVAGETTPPLTPSARNFASADLPQLEKSSSSGSSSPNSASCRSSVTQLIDPPIRLSSLRPPANLQSTPRCSTDAPRKVSLTDANEQFLRLQISRKPVPPPAPYPSTPRTPPSTSHSHSSAPRTRPSSLANITTPPPSSAVVAYRSNRHTSATSSELSTMCPYLASSTTTSPPSVGRASDQLQHTISAWEDSDSEDEEKVGLLGYWRGRRWRGSRGSIGGSSGQARRDSASKEEGRKAETGSGRRRNGFVRALSCGCED